MINSLRNLLIHVFMMISMVCMWMSAKAEVKPLDDIGFRVEHKIKLPGSPTMIYDASTGDISGWWDHSFSGSPFQLYIEPRAGGGFYEQFDESGDGVMHATVIVANRGKLLRFDGPLGLSGKAIKMVCTYEFSPAGSDSTLLKLTVNLAGAIEEGMPEIIDSVWHHFLFDQFQPYILQNMHLLEPFEKNEKWGYKNSQGQVVIKPVYHLAGRFNQYGLAAVVDDSGWLYITMNGEPRLRPYIVDNGPDYFSEGLARFVNDHKIGFMDESGTVVISAKFDFAMPFSEGLAAFCVGCKQVSDNEYHRVSGGLWGYIDKTGKIIVNPDYESAGSFKNGQAKVLKGEKQSLILRKDIGE